MCFKLQKPGAVFCRGGQNDRDGNKSQRLNNEYLLFCLTGMPTAEIGSSDCLTSNNNFI